MPEKSANVMVSRVYRTQIVYQLRLFPIQSFCVRRAFLWDSIADARQITIEESQRCRFMSFAAGCFG